MRDKCISLLNNRRYKFDVEHELRVLFHFTFLVSSRIFGVGLSPRKSLKHFPFAIFVINHKMEIFVSIGRYSFTVERQKDLVCLGIRHRYKLNRNIMAILRNNIYTLVCNIFRGFTFSQENIGVTFPQYSYRISSYSALSTSFPVDFTRYPNSPSTGSISFKVYETLSHALAPN